MTKWIFLGDDSRFIFISRLLQIPLEEIDGEKTLIIRRGEKILSREISGGGNLIFSSWFLPPKIEIFLSTYSEEINFDTENFDNCAIFEPVHGSAPDIAGQDKANPTALLLSAIEMLNYINMPAVGQNIKNALFDVLKSDIKTADLGGTYSLSKYTEEIIARL